MNFRRLIGLTALFVALAGCAGPTTLTYSVTSDIADDAKSFAVFEASERVLTRRLAGADVRNAVVTVLPAGNGAAVMSLKVPDAEGAATAERILSEPFIFDIRLEGPKLPGMLEDETNWLPTGVDGSMLLWVIPIANPDTQEIGVELQFNEQGRDLLEAAFKDNKDKSVGIFVRDLLVSRMTITAEAVTDHIIITGIPSEHVAQIFADDVNVGLHATFTKTK